MGNNSESISKEKYISKEELKLIAAESNIIEIFNKNKNSDGVITVKELQNISKGLLTASLCKKIIRICSTTNNKLTKDDLVYFFAILSSNSFQVKMNFLLDFIFTKKNKLEKSKYKKRVLKYYQQSEVLTNALLNEKLIQNADIIQREDVYNFNKNNNYDEISQYSLYINNASDINIDDDFKFCNCSTSNKRRLNYSTSSYNYRIISNNKLNYLENEFERIQYENGNIFPIALFENMLKDINVIQSLIDIIGNYLRQKSQKNFINYNLFVEIISLFQFDTDIDTDNNESNNKDIILDRLFDLFSYPNDYVTKTAFFIFVKSTKKNLSSNVINKLFEENKIETNIYKDKFKRMINYISNELIESFEHIKYLNYIFFNQDLDNKKLEKNCIDLLLKGKDINEYIMERIDYDEKFYIIDSKFWNKWNSLIHDTNINFEEFENLKLNTKDICRPGGILKEGVVYLKDYIILSPVMYNLFAKWYNFQPDEEIERERIIIDNSEVTNLNFKIKDINNIVKNADTFFDIEEHTIPTSPQNNENENLNEYVLRNKKYEIEIFPIFLVFYKMEDIISKGLNTLKYLKQVMKSITEDKSNFKYNKFSRKDKISYLISQLQEYFENKLTPNTARLWIYYNDNIEIIPFEDTLEKHGIANVAFVIIELKQNGFWQTEKLDKKIMNESRIPLVGLQNVGNSCYMNSVLQIFLNIPQIKKIFVQELNNEEKNENQETKVNQKFLNFLENKTKKLELFKQFISLLNSKWNDTKRTLNPKVFKDICGNYNQAFKEYEQQDAYDFYTFLLDALHEESNIKINYQQIKNSETIDTSEQDLADEYWANTIRNNASYFYALFMGQLQSKLICSKCKKEKIKFEPFNALNLPIPEESKIIIKICLFRLPITLSPFYGNNKERESQNNSLRSKIMNNKKINDIRTKLVKIKDIHIGPYTKYSNLNIYPNKNKKNNENHLANNSQSQRNINLNTEFFENENKENNIINNEEEIISNALVFNIPVRIKIEIDRNKKCQEIINILKDMKELHLDIKNIYTEFVIFNEDYNIINGEKIINNNIFPLKEIYIYELLSYEGIKKVFGYDDLPNNEVVITKINEQKDIPNQANKKLKDYSDIKNTTQSIKINEENNNEKSLSNINIYYHNDILNENLIEIIHRQLKYLNQNKTYFDLPLFEHIKTNKDYIILTNQNSIKPFNLYEIMWEKYMYFLDKPYNKYLWWKSSNATDIDKSIKYKKCSPFVIKIIWKSNNACAFCPWFKFCTGCILSPDKDEYINFNPNWKIIVEWCKEIVEKEINQNNLQLKLYHSSYKKDFSSNETQLDKLSIYDCLELFTQKEILKDILCENCNIKTTFTKELKIERLPEYLFIVFKRFKYISKYSTKIENIISFPFENVELDKYLMQKNKKNKRYDLYGIINHRGTLLQGHYYCDIKKGNKWIRYDDSFVEEDTDINISNVYILVYKSNNKEYYKNKQYNFYFNFFGLMDTAYKIYLSQNNFEHLFNYVLNEKEEIIEEFKENCQYYYGEPVTINNQKGFLVNVYKSNNDDSIYAKIKIKKSFINTKINNIQIKDTIKEENKENNNSKNNTTICSGCNII